MDPHQPLSILLVEDEKDACEIISSMLSMAYPQASIYTATDGKAGFAIFSQYTPEIVITDINMPEMDGLQLLQRIAEIKPATRLIVVTAHSDKQYLDRITSSGIVVDIVYKPVNFATLFDLINCRHNRSSKPATNVTPATNIDSPIIA